jgi:hypothetical protein
MREPAVPHLLANRLQRVDGSGLFGDGLQLVEQGFGLVEAGRVVGGRLSNAKGHVSQFTLILKKRT